MSGVAWPNGLNTPPRIAGHFGPRTPFWTPGGWTANFHYGTDIVGFADICSPVDGVVTFAGYTTRGFGNFLRIRGDNGDEYGHAHIAPNGFYVGAGARVRARQPVARMGTTGKSTGVHLHWEVYPGGGSPVDSVPYMARQPRPAGGGATPFDPDGDDEMNENQNTMLTELYLHLLPGKANMRNQGSVHKLIADTHAAATATQKTLDAHIAEWLQGITGVRHAGRLYVLLARAATSGGDVDEKALAEALAPILETNLDTLSDAEVERLAKATADEQDRRARERLDN